MPSPASGGGLAALRARFDLVRLPFENCIASTSIFVLPSYKEPTVDALASTTDEGRGIAAISHGQLHSKRYEPWMSEWGNPAPLRASLRCEHIAPVEGTGGIETSQYPEEKKTTVTP